METLAIPPIILLKEGYRILPISDDFPDPLTPVITVIVLSGIVTSIFFRLFSLAPIILIELFHFLRLVGISIFSLFR